MLNAIEPPESRAWLFDNVLPFELEVIHARLKYWAGDHMAYLDTLYALLHKCKVKARQAGRQAAAVAASRASAGGSKPVDATDGSAMLSVMWKERGVRICLIMASQLMEMNVGLRCPLWDCLLTILLGSSSCNKTHGAVVPPAQSDCKCEWLATRYAQHFCPGLALSYRKNVLAGRKLTYGSKTLFRCGQRPGC